MTKKKAAEPNPESAYERSDFIRDLKKASRKELEALSKSLLALFPDRCRKGESGRVGGAGAYWEARG